MDSSDAVTALSALAQASRLHIYRLLVQTGPDGLSAGRIGEALSLPASTLSFHLTQLHHAGMIRSRRDGRSVIYSAEYTAMNGLLAFLTDNCCQGDPDQCLPPRCEPDTHPSPSR